MADYSEDYLLDKRVKIFQPLNGYRASTDAVILSSLISKVKANDKVLDVGSGTGAIALCIASRFKDEGLEIKGIELQADLARLANQSAKANDFANVSFINANIYEQPLPFCSFNHVISNPPYTDHDMPSPNASKALAHNHRDFNLQDWIKFCIKMIKPQGYFYMINRAEAIDEILAAIHSKLGKIVVIPLYSKPEQNAKRVMICAQKDSKAPSTIHPGLVVHKEDGTYSGTAHKILRQGLGFFEANSA